MGLIILVIVSLFVYNIGKVVGRVEQVTATNTLIVDLINSIKKVEQLSELKGEDASKLSTQEFVYRVQKQLELKNEKLND
jgi:hypothetical protein